MNQLPCLGLGRTEPSSAQIGIDLSLTVAAAISPAINGLGKNSHDSAVAVYTWGMVQQNADQAVHEAARGGRLPYLLKNPVEGLKLPPPKKGRRAKPYITPQQFQGLIALMSEPYASMIFVAVYTGFRVSEIVGLRWRNVHEDSITIDERYSRGDWGAPKSHASNATVAVNDAVMERIERLKTLEVEVRAGSATRRV